MNCICCGSVAVTERPEVTARGYRRFRCRDCGRQFNERSGGVLNRTYGATIVMSGRSTARVGLGKLSQRPGLSGASGRLTCLGAGGYGETGRLGRRQPSGGDSVVLNHSQMGTNSAKYLLDLFDPG